MLPYLKDTHIRYRKSKAPYIASWLFKKQSQSKTILTSHVSLGLRYWAAFLSPEAIEYDVPRCCS